MDSITQIALGAAVGLAVGGRKIGRKAALIGAVCGTIPDLDVFIDMGSDVADFTYHRGFSHSILFNLLLTPLIVLVLSRIKWFGIGVRDFWAYAMVGLALVTHPLLDAMTIYGTQLLWPFHVAPAGIGSIFIIDPLYTFPLLIGVMWYLVTKNMKANKIGLIVSCFYMLWTVSAQNTVRDMVISQFDQKPSHILVQPTPFNTLLWRIVVVEDDAYQVGYYSLLDSDKNIDFRSYPSNRTLLEPIADSWAVQRLDWFTKGFYVVENRDNAVVMTDIRMGMEPDQYVLAFRVGEVTEQGINVSEPDMRMPALRDMSRLSTVWARIWDEDVSL